MEALKTVTDILRVHRQGEKIKWTSQKHWKKSLTYWGCPDKEKRSDGFHRNTGNSHWHPEGAQTRRKDQMDFTEALKKVTDILKVHRQGEKIRWTSQKHWKQSLTYWGCTDKEKRLGRLHRSTKNSHLHTEGTQAGRKDQMDFTEALKTSVWKSGLETGKRPELNRTLTDQDRKWSRPVRTEDRGPVFGL